MPKLTHDQIVERERALNEKALKERQIPAIVIAEDRAKRWSQFLENFPVRDEIAEWSARMTSRRARTDVTLPDGETVDGTDGTTCHFYANRNVSWVLALLLCRYGEAEYHWPDDGFFDEDVKRAKEWLDDEKKPEGVLYL